jgi:hypothetical protein
MSVADAQAAYVAALQQIVDKGTAANLRAQVETLQKEIIAAEGDEVQNARAALAAMDHMKRINQPRQPAAKAGSVAK